MRNAMVSFKIFNVPDFTTNNYITHYPISTKVKKIGQLIKCSARNTFFQISCRKLGRETSSRVLFVF